MSPDANSWECGVCGYVHKEEAAPEKCPVCDAPQVMFAEKKAEEAAEAVVEEQVDPVEEHDKKWRCKVSGYLHTGPKPPEKCPICEATAVDFEEVTEEEKPAELVAPLKQASGEKRWRCTVCGYIHNGEEPPEKCPVCAAPASMFIEIDSEGNAVGEVEAAAIEPIFSEKQGDEIEAGPPTKFDKISALVLKLHLHPITAHFPNGIIPAAVIFLGLALYFNIALLETAAYFNLIFVLINLPVVLLTGFMEWQKRYKGIKTSIFLIKIICAILVIGTANVLVFWRLIDPTVFSAESPSRLIYFGIAAGMLAATGLAGHLGGKLVHGTRAQQ